jgi:methylase of polypeptide subunit release factors
LDVGTGCGVLGLSVLLHNPGYFSWAILSDFSPDALEVARENYGLVELRIKNWESRSVEFVHSSLLDFLDTSWIAASSRLDETPRNDEASMIAGKDVILVANLPYIPDATFDANVDETVKKWEPRMAFVGWDDGLDLYREMFEQLFQLFKSSTASGPPPLSRRTNLVMFLEMMTWQIDILRAEFGERMVFSEVKTFHFNIRIVQATLWR